MAEVRLTPGGAPETVLPEPPADVMAALAAAGGDRDRVAETAAANPEMPEVWAALGGLCESGAKGLSDHLEAYAYYRIGYHRGLDALRQNGWRGSGYVRGLHPSNRGFLSSLDGLRRMAGAIGETSEAERCGDFLLMLDPAYQLSPGP
ncbi:MAG: DUF3151 family protein [Acidimicrobiia bacterium]|nr:DUF3151 family protein [Acidimicrobiia bacterium]MXX45055.1 DUF3151 family protein [Acidimicrobiia bacterium]MXY74244.1 DUF3151 family protein [Acidimicrobiia bacterium]MYA39704.1 DUF3151 family protein [Acidimicrobiia bacterium]MYB77999.1 DUF3151 family protein [Acidimicrobiia bacterium]